MAKNLVDITDFSESFNELITIEGMLAGYFTSPLIEELNLTRFVDDIKYMDDDIRDLYRDNIARRKKELAEERRAAPPKGELTKMNGLEFRIEKVTA